MIAADDLTFACLIYVVVVGCIVLLGAVLHRKDPDERPSRTGLIIALVALGVAMLILWALSASL